MSRIILTLSLVLTLATAARAFDEPTARRHMAGECVECAAYYDVIANYLEATRPLDKDLAERYRSISRKLAGQARELGEENDRAVEDAEAGMAREIRQDCNALAPIKDRYKEICRGLVEKPKARMNYWLERRN
ncbi:MAG TPA: hypothetical protein PKB11_10330 [Desulfovibrio sp.]|uniref:hypothetical protein n=1 Tax=Desulfovibrio sp. TaxID=885 RepID=UPI002D0FAC05|nr:hypothetical protein [Desulfovibrio sp.]HMM39141.1 hypothetical protein [Desulfovibrio sp.]